MVRLNSVAGKDIERINTQRKLSTTPTIGLSAYTNLHSWGMMLKEYAIGEMYIHAWSRKETAY